MSQSSPPIPQTGSAMLADEDDPLMKPGEVASVFRVDPKTVQRWARAGKIKSVKTLGGHLRIRRSWVEEAIKRMTEEARRDRSQ